MRRPRVLLLLAAGACVALIASAVRAAADDGALPDGLGPEGFFLRRIRPVLADRCWRCHGPGRQRGSLRLDSRDAVLRGGRVRDVEPGRPEASRLIDAIGYEDGDLQMPPDGRLSDGQIADFVRWVRIGVPWAEPPPGAAPEPGVRDGEPPPARGLLAFAGRFHPLVVHFPIALILAAALGEVASVVAARRARPVQAAGFAIAARHSLFLGGLGAAASAALGWAAAGQARLAGDAAAYLDVHRALGTLVALLALALHRWSRRLAEPAAGRHTAYRVALVACALLVGLVGHLGGSLTHGIGWLGVP